MYLLMPLDILELIYEFLFHLIQWLWGNSLFFHKDFFIIDGFMVYVHGGCGRPPVLSLPGKVRGSPYDRNSQYSSRYHSQLPQACQAAYLACLTLCTKSSQALCWKGSYPFPSGRLRPAVVSSHVYSQCRRHPLIHHASCILQVMALGFLPLSITPLFYAL
jgi:hypothetical protein